MIQHMKCSNATIAKLLPVHYIYCWHYFCLLGWNSSTKRSAFKHSHYGTNKGVSMALPADHPTVQFDILAPLEVVFSSSSFVTIATIYNTFDTNENWKMWWSLSRFIDVCSQWTSDITTLHFKNTRRSHPWSSYTAALSRPPRVSSRHRRYSLASVYLHGTTPF